MAVALLQTLISSLEREFLLLDCYQTKSNNNLPPAPPRIPPEVERELTPREREVLRLRLSGMTVAKIAKELCIGVSTVKTHCEHIYKKLGVKKLAELFSKLFGQ